MNTGSDLTSFQLQATGRSEKRRRETTRRGFEIGSGRPPPAANSRRLLPLHLKFLSLLRSINQEMGEPKVSSCSCVPAVATGALQPMPRATHLWAWDFGGRCPWSPPPTRDAFPGTYVSTSLPPTHKKDGSDGLCLACGKEEIQVPMRVYMWRSIPSPCPLVLALITLHPTQHPTVRGHALPAPHALQALRNEAGDRRAVRSSLFSSSGCCCVYIRVLNG